MKHTESKLQSEIFQYLRLFFEIVFMVPNDAPGKSDPVTVGRLKAMGMLPGVSDLVVICNNGKAIFLEIKTSTGRQSESQKRFEQKCIDLNVPYYILRSLDDAKKIVELYT